jgi:type IV pilus biogenesis/stability protein PilW
MIRLTSDYSKVSVYQKKKNVWKVDIVKSILPLVLILMMAGCSSKPDNASKDTQLVRNATSSLSIALAYLQLGNSAKAEPNLQKALTENPSSGAVYLGFALYYQQLGDYEKAEAAFFQAKRFSPPSLIPQDFVTYLCRKGEYDSATSHYTSVVSVAGERIKKSLLLELADCYYQQEYWTEAEGAYKQSLNYQSGDNDKALLKLAELALNNGDSQSALDYLTRFDDTKVQVTAESLLLQIKTYEALAIDDKAEQASNMLATLFPNHDYVSQQNAETAAEEIAKQQLVLEKKVTTPVVQEEKKEVAVSTPPTVDKGFKFHTLMKGETLYRVTRIYNVSLAQLQTWNPDLKADDISIGTKIYLEER